MVADPQGCMSASPVATTLGHVLAGPILSCCPQQTGSGYRAPEILGGEVTHLQLGSTFLSSAISTRIRAAAPST